MTPQAPAAYLALRQYIGQLLADRHDRAWQSVPAALHPNLTHFMRGKTMYEDLATGQAMIHGHDLAGWATELLYGAGLAQPLPLAMLDVAELLAAARQ